MARVEPIQLKRPFEIATASETGLHMFSPAVLENLNFDALNHSLVEAR